MKKIYLSFMLLLAVLCFANPLETKAQIYNPYYSMYFGFGYMPLATGYYIGQIYAGFPNGNGYIYYYDMRFGWIAYQGGFCGGVAHGKGEMLCCYGYIAGIWDKGNFVEQINVCQDQIQRSYNNIMQQSQSYAPQNSSTIKLPQGTEIQQIDSSSELGRKLLGKMSK